MRGDQLARQWRLIQRLARSRWGVGLDELAGDLECHKRTVYRDLDAPDARRLPGALRAPRRQGLLPLPRELQARRRALHARRDPVAGVRRGPAPHARGHRLPRLDPLGARQDPREPRPRALGVPGAARRVVPRAAGPARRLRRAARHDPHAQRLRARTPHRVDALPHRAARVASAPAISTPTASGTGTAALYVVGLDHDSGEVRTFAVDRIRSIEPSRRRFQVPASFDFDAYIGAAFGVVARAADARAHPLRPALGRLGRRAHLARDARSSSAAAARSS